MKKLSSIQGVALLLSLLFLFTNCSIYTINRGIKPENIGHKRLGSSTNPIIGTPSKIIIHLGKESWQMVNYVIDDKTIKGELIPVNEDISFYYELAHRKRNFRVTNKEKTFAKQVHLFVENMNYDNTTAEISLSDVNRCEAITKNRGLMSLIKIPLFLVTVYSAYILLLMIG